MKNKQIFTIILFFFCFISLAQITSIGNAINKAGRQRMLTQRMTKNYVAILGDVKTEDAIKELDESAAAFNEAFSELSFYITDKDTKASMDYTAKLWSNFRLKITNKPTLDGLNLLISESQDLVSACNVVVEKLVSNSGQKTAFLPNISGRQRMFSQKLALFYLLNYIKSDYSKTLKEIEDTAKLFEISLNVLLDNPTNTPEMNFILKMQKEEWNFLKKSFDFESNSTLLPGSVYSSTNIVLKNFDKLTVMYENSAN